MYKLISIIVLLFLFSVLNAQLVEVESNFTSGGDCVFGATNFAKTPVFVQIEFTELRNTTNDETRLYIRKLSPGYSNLFTLVRDIGAGYPYFYYKAKSHRSDPTAIVNLDFPYLIPFAPGKKVTVFDVKNIEGFWGETEPKSWRATGFYANHGDEVYSARNGDIVEIAGAKRNDDTKTWYNAWTNNITVLQPDGTLICYKNVVDREKKLKINQKIYAGEKLGEIAPDASQLILLIYQNTISSDDLLFLIPQFQIDKDKMELLNPAMKLEVIHPLEIRGLEMTNKERKKILGLKN